MAAVPTPLLPSSSHRGPKMSLSIASNFAIRVARTSSTSQLPASQLRLLLPLSSWSGLKNLGVPSSHRLLCLRVEKKRKCRGNTVYASLFGVGAPEALVIGVVALLVFGPKGLAELARNLGKTLRSFQPTIKELQEVSREFKSTLEREIGLDEVAASTNYANKSALKTEDKEQSVVDPNGKPSNSPQTYDELLKISENQFARSVEKSQIEASSDDPLQVPHSEKSELEATSAKEEVQDLSAENSQEPPTVEGQAQSLNATQSEREITAVGDEPKAVFPSEVSSTAPPK